MAGAIINCAVTVGRAVDISTGACMYHNYGLADGEHDCTRAGLAGNVVVGDGSWVGIGACARQVVTISRDLTFGAGASATAEVTDGPTVVGVPASPIVRSVPAG